MAEGINWSEVTPPNPPTTMSKIPAWATGMAIGEVLGEGFIEDEAWAGFLGGDAGVSEEMAEGVTAMFQNLMSQVMSTLGSSTDFLDEMDDEENPAAGLVPT